MPPPPIVPDDAVTASDLARHFGQVQRRALQAPVYVLHHGRPQFVLASIEFMHALSAIGPARSHDDLADLLDTLTDPVLICDSKGIVVAAGRAARLCFGETAQPGARLDAILDQDAADLLGDIVARVAHGRIAERTQLPSAGGRPQLALDVGPSSSGVVVIGYLAGVADARDAAQARAVALAEAVSFLPGHAAFVIDARGRVVSHNAAQLNFANLSPDELSDMAFVRLFADSSKSAIENGLAAAFAGKDACAIDGDLLVRDRAAAVTIALAPIHRGTGIEVVQAIIAPRIR